MITPTNNNNLSGPSGTVFSDKPNGSVLASGDIPKRPGKVMSFLKREVSFCRARQNIIESRKTVVQQSAVPVLSEEKALSPKEMEIARLEKLDKTITESDTLAHALVEEYGSHAYMRTAARNGYIDIIKFLVERMDVKVYKNSYHAPIWEAVNSGHLEIVDYLTDHGLDSDNTYYINVIVSGDDNLIHAAIESSKMDTNTAKSMIALLLEKGEPVDGWGFIAPIWEAKRRNKEELMNFLLEYGAAPSGLEGFNHVNANRTGKKSQRNFSGSNTNFVAEDFNGLSLHSISKAESALSNPSTGAAESCEINIDVTTVQGSLTPPLQHLADNIFEAPPPFDPYHHRPEPSAPPLSEIGPYTDEPPSYEEALKMPKLY